MIKSTDNIKVYFVSIPAHKFLHIKNYESSGYFDFWKKQGEIPGQDGDTICGLLDSIKGKLDCDDGVIGTFSGQIMAHIFEEVGKCPIAYGTRLPADYKGAVPEQMLLMDVPEADYIVFEHDPFDYEHENESVGKRLERAMEYFSFENTVYKFDETSGRISYFYHDPERYAKWIRPVFKNKY